MHAWGIADIGNDMQIISIIDCIQANKYMLKTFADGLNAFERVYATASTIGHHCVVFASRSVPQSELYAYQAGKNVQADILYQETWTMELFLEKLKTIAEQYSQNEDVLFIVFQGDAPLIDREIAQRLISLYTAYHPDYAFADGYPPGFSPELLRAQVLSQLIMLAKQHAVPYSRSGIFSVIQKDINVFDIETELAPVDLRPYRCVPICNNKRNFYTAQNLWHGGIRSGSACAERLPGEEQFLRTLPAFYSIQITEGCPSACSYCPYPRMQGDPRGKTGYMPLDTFITILDQISRFSEDAVIDLSLWGEPAMHPEIEAIVHEVLNQPELTLIIETSGIGWKEETIAGILDMAGKIQDTRQYSPFEGPRLHYIVSLDAWKPETYEKLRGQGFDTALAFARRLVSSYPQGTHIQAVRMKENEEELEEFYRSWKKVTEHIIIQNYECFSGSLPDHRVTDITPIRRMACRHLARDMSILMDGSVPVCKYALTQERFSYQAIAGNILQDGVEAVWESLGVVYQRHCIKDYPDFCRSCDEYYTYNA